MHRRQRLTVHLIGEEIFLLPQSGHGDARRIAIGGVDDRIEGI